MDRELVLDKLLKKGVISSELEFQRATMLDRKLMLASKDNPSLKESRKQLRALLAAYEDLHWSGAEELTDEKVIESDLATGIAEHEHIFNVARKKIIKAKLKEVGLTQKQFGLLLGHSSETYISELINNINPFTLADLILIHKILNVELAFLIPTFLNPRVVNRVSAVVHKFNNPHLESRIEELVEELVEA